MSTQELCAQAYAGGDLDYFRSAGCAMTSSNDSLIAAAKKAAKTKTILLVGGGILATAFIIYLSVKK